jgi:hypothetical protein
MKHLSREQIIDYLSGGQTLLARFVTWLHLMTCKECRIQLEQERQFAVKASRSLKRITSHAKPSQHMDNRVLSVIEFIAKETAKKAPVFGRWVYVTTMVVVLLLSSYGIFFYAPVVGSNNETLAEALVSSRIRPVMAMSEDIIPNSSDHLRGKTFFDVWCDRLMVCAPEYTRLVYLEGNSIDDVFNSSIIAHELGVSTETVLPMVKDGMTWGQILGKLGIAFPTQLRLPEDVSRSMSETAEEIDKKTTIEMNVVKHGDGHVSSSEQLPQEIIDQLPEGESEVEFDKKTRQPTGKIVKNETPSMITGEITSISEGNEAFTLTTADNSFIVRIMNSSELLRYGDYLLPIQLTEGQICTVEGEPVDGELIAMFVDVREPARTETASGTVLYIEENSLTIAGFGSALYIDEDSQIKGTLEEGSTVEFTATGNEIEGFTVDALTAEARPEPTPTKVQPRSEITGVVVGVDPVEQLILLADGTSIYYNFNTTFDNDMLPSIGQTVTSTAFSSNTFTDQRYQDQAISVDLISNRDLSKTFEVAGTYTDHVCLNGCNWLRPEGVTKVILDGKKANDYLIIPSTDGHSLISPGYKGLTVVLKGFFTGDLRIVQSVVIVEPSMVQNRAGIVTEMTEKGDIVTLDDGTKISIASYTTNAGMIKLGDGFQFECWRSDDGQLTALKVTMNKAEKVVSTDWLTVSAFDGQILTLSDGTKVTIDEHTRIESAVLGEEITTDSIKVGLKVLCEYRDEDTKTATLVKVFVKP